MSSNPEAARSCDPAPLLPSHQPAADATEPSPSMDRRILLGLAGVAGVAAIANFAKAGQLSPPAGPITPTGSSLSEISAKTSEAKLTLNAIEKKVARTDQGVSEPRTPLAACAQPPGSDCLFRITVPGAYCMTENIDQAPGVACCVSIECDGVDLDCQGFAFVGSGNAASPPSSCVRASGRADIEMYDCAVRDWRGCPIDCDDCDDCYFSDFSFRHCTCPAGFHADGSASPGAMIRCRDGCEIDDVAVSSCDGCALQVRDSSSISDVRWTSCSGQACVCRDSCCVEDLALVGCTLTVSGTPGGSPTGLITLGASCSSKGVEGRVCTCPLGQYFCVLGVRCTAEDATHTTVYGDCIFCDDHCSLSDMQFASCTGHGIQARTGACIEDVSFHTHEGDCITVLDNAAVCDVECRACTGVAITCGAGACVEEVAISSHTGDCVRCADGSCVTETECRNIIGIAISVGRSSLIEDCDVSGGGRAPTGGGSYRCGDGSCVRRSRSASRDDSMDIVAPDNCSVEDCTVVRGQGISVGSACCVSCNKLSACTGGPDSTAGMGGAILVTGEHTSVEENELTNCRVAISVQSSGHFCSVDDNHVSASVGGIAAGVVAAAAARVMCTCNHLRVPIGAEPFIAGTSSFGPLVNITGGGSNELASSHVLSNFIIS